MRKKKHPDVAYKSHELFDSSLAPGGYTVTSSFKLSKPLCLFKLLRLKIIKHFFNNLGFPMRSSDHVDFGKQEVRD